MPLRLPARQVDREAARQREVPLVPGRVAQDADRRVAEVADAAIGLRHAERGQVEVRLVGVRQARIHGVAAEDRLAGELAAGAAGRRRSTSGSMLLMPALFDEQLGVIAWPLSIAEDAGDLPVAEQLLDDRHLGPRRHVVAVGCGDVVPAIVGGRPPVAGPDRGFAADLVGVRVVAGVALALGERVGDSPSAGRWSGGAATLQLHARCTAASWRRASGT